MGAGRAHPRAPESVAGGAGSRRSDGRIDYIPYDSYVVSPQSAFFMSYMDIFLFIWGRPQQRYSYNDLYNNYINDD